MNCGRHVGEADEIAEILERRIAANAIEVAHEGRAVDRREDCRLAADLHVALGIARVLDERFGRRLQNRTAEALGKAYAAFLDVGAGLLPHLERLWVVAKLDADLL